MANLMVAVKISPTEYKALTMLERDELIKAIERSSKQKQ